MASTFFSFVFQCFVGHMGESSMILRSTTSASCKMYKEVEKAALDSILVERCCMGIFVSMGPRLQDCELYFAIAKISVE